MADVFTVKKRREIMRAIRGTDTTPELIVRRLTHSLGYRYRLHVKSLLGSPDLVFPSRHKIIFVHGCFWHRHNCRKGRSMPATRKKFWRDKLEKNKQRDQKTRRILRKDDWEILTIWECQTKKTEQLSKRICYFLEK